MFHLPQHTIILWPDIARLSFHSGFSTVVTGRDILSRVHL